MWRSSTALSGRRSTKTTTLECLLAATRRRLSDHRPYRAPRRIRHLVPPNQPQSGRPESLGGQRGPDFGVQYVSVAERQPEFDSDQRVQPAAVWHQSAAAEECRSEFLLREAHRREDAR